jgi:chemotaxis protein MotB
MKRFVWKGSLVAVLACTLASQGCLVPWGKYLKVKRQLEQCQEEVAEKDSMLSNLQTRIDGLRNQLTSKDQLIKLYQDKYEDAQEMAEKVRSELEKVRSRVEEYAQRTPGAEYDPNTGALHLANTLLFETGKAVISDKGKAALQDLAQTFQGTGDALQIDGHTDDVRVAQPETKRKHTDNWGLSAHRALAVLRSLAQGGMPERRMYIRAFSMYRPRVPNSSAENRGKNRRVDIMILPAGGPATPLETMTEEPAEEGTE